MNTDDILDKIAGRSRPDDIPIHVLRSARTIHEESLLHYFAVEGDLNAVKYLAQRGVDLELKNKFGNTALMDCVRLKNIDMIEALLMLGANPNAVDSEGNTSLHLAYQYNAAEAIRDILIRHGASGSAKNIYGEIPCHSE